MSDFKGHSPQLGCKWTECHGDKKTECPFKGNSKLAVANAPDECLHEWRQYWIHTTQSNISPHGFYCVWCLTHHLDD